jgi:hypothetical protein
VSFYHLISPTSWSWVCQFMPADACIWLFLITLIGPHFCASGADVCAGATPHPYHSRTPRQAPGRLRRRTPYESNIFPGWHTRLHSWW